MGPPHSMWSTPAICKYIDSYSKTVHSLQAVSNSTLQIMVCLFLSYVVKTWTAGLFLYSKVFSRHVTGAHPSACFPPQNYWVITGILHRYHKLGCRISPWLGCLLYAKKKTFEILICHAETCTHLQPCIKSSFNYSPFKPDLTSQLREGGGPWLLPVVKYMQAVWLTRHAPPHPQKRKWCSGLVRVKAPSRIVSQASV